MVSTMPYQNNYISKDASIRIRDHSKYRLIRLLHKRGLYYSKGFTWDWFINQVADEMEKGNI